MRRGTLRYPGVFAKKNSGRHKPAAAFEKREKTEVVKYYKNSSHIYNVENREIFRKNLYCFFNFV